MTEYEKYYEFEKAANEIDERTGNANDENSIESEDDKDCIHYAPNSKKLMTCFFTRKRWINKVVQYSEQYPDEVQIKHVNKDGSIIAHVPVDYLRISRPPKLSDDEKQRRAELLSQIRTH